MPLYLCTHQLEAPSASVPLSMIVLTDLIRRRQIPETLRCRMVFPTSGATSASAWDAPSATALEAWLNDNLNQDVAHELNEVQEDFAHGLAFELSRARTADRVAANSRSTLQRLSQTASRANDGLHKQLEELGGNGGFLSAAESALARMRGPAAAHGQPTPASAPASTQAQQPPPESAYSRAASTYTWLQSKVRGTGLFNAQHLAPRAQPASTTHSGQMPPASGLDMGLEHGGDMGLDAAAVAASTGPLPPSYTAASAPSWEEDEPYVLSNLANDDEGADKGQAGREEQQRNHASEAAAGAAAGAAEARREWEWGVGSDFLEQQKQQEQQQQQQQQQQHSQQGGQNQQDSEQQGGQRSYAGAVQQAHPQQQQQQQQQQPQPQQQQRQQQPQSQQAIKAPMFVLDGDDDEGAGSGNQRKEGNGDPGSERLEL